MCMCVKCTCIHVRVARNMYIIFIRGRIEGWVWSRGVVITS